jgi:oxygen-dependent protoporphyrinogen oxidase
VPRNVSQSSSLRVAVVGGGVSGLAAAHRIGLDLPGVEVLVFEASGRLGGSLHTAEVGGVVVDVGAEAMLNRRPEAVGLVQEVGLGADVVHPASTSANLWNRGRLVPMPRTMMGVPLDLRTLDGVISAKGLARAAMDNVLPPTELGDRDVSVGDLVEGRLGKEIVDRLVEPLLGGVYAGHAREISARAAVPQIVALLGQDRSLTRAAAAATPPLDPATAPLFAGIRGGVGRLPGAIATASGATVRTGATVRELARRPAGGWNLVVGSTRDAEVVGVDAVVLATSARTSARLLSDVAPSAGMTLAGIEHASVAIVTLAFPARAFPAVAGSGFLVPPIDGRSVKASTFSFAKWDWVREAGAATGEEMLVMRCSLGRHREEKTLQVSDEELVEVALRDLADAIGLSVRPADSHVERWGGGLPQYAVGHLDRIAGVRRELASLPGLAVCGSAYDGVGIPACIASAEVAAGKILADLAPPT